LWIENHLIPYLIGGNTTRPLEKRDLEELRLDDLGLVSALRELGLPTGLSSILSEGGAYRVRIDVPVKQRALV
jgi:hypothetical protein